MADITGDISSKLTKILEIKKDIANAIINKGGTVTNSDSFESYADKIRGLTLKGELKTLNADENKTYYADNEDGVTGWSKVVVNVKGSGSGGSSGGGSSSGGVEYDENGFTKLPQVHIIYYNEDKTIWAEEDIDAGDNGTHLNDGPPKEAVNGVQYKFRRWEPEPVGVQGNISCYPKYRKLEQEIEDSWEEIARNRGGDYDAGDWRILETGWVDPFSDLGMPQRLKFRLAFEKVYAGEDGTTSTWLLKQIINVIGTNGGVPHVPMGGMTYKDSQLRQWLNNNFYKALPDPLRDAIQPVVKYVPGEYSNGAPNEDGGIALPADKVWIPGRTEILGNDGSAESRYYEQGVEYTMNSTSLGGASYFFRSNDINKSEPGYFRGFGGHWSQELSLKYDQSSVASGSSMIPDYAIFPRIGFCL